MKVKISLAFIGIYILLLVLTAPASLILRFIPDNSGVKIGQISGSLWNGKASQVEYRHQFRLQKLTWKIDWFALFTLKIKTDIKFNDVHKDIIGTGAVGYGFSGLILSDVNVDMQAVALLPFLKLPAPVIPSGNFNLIIESATMGSPYCDELDGYLVWHDAKVGTPMGHLDLATPSLDLSCDEDSFVGSLKQKSEELTTNALITLEQGGQYQLEGDIMGHDKLDPSILQALSWIGPKAETGETKLNFKGRI